MKKRFKIILIVIVIVALVWFLFPKQSNYFGINAALNYAHGWLDAGARSGVFDVHDSRLFTVDDE